MELFTESLTKLAALWMGSFGAILMVLSFIGTILCWFIWIPVNAFLHKWWWGLVALFAPFGNFIFTICFWQKAKRAFLTGLVFLAVTIFIFVSRSFIVLGSTFNRDLLLTMNDPDCKSPLEFTAQIKSIDEYTAGNTNYITFDNESSNDSFEKIGGPPKYLINLKIVSDGKPNTKFATGKEISIGAYNLTGVPTDSAVGLRKTIDPNNDKGKYFKVECIFAFL